MKRVVACSLVVAVLVFVVPFAGAQGRGMGGMEMLDKVKPGDKVDFSFSQSGKDYLVSEIK